MVHHRLQLAILVLLPILTLSGCFGKNNPTLDVPDDIGSSHQPGETLVDVEASTLSAGFVDQLKEAETLARTWRVDAQLHAATFAWPSTLAVGRSKRVYVFGSTSDPLNWWTVAMNEETAEQIRPVIPKEDYLGSSLGPVALQYWQLNPVQALQIAETRGGTNFRSSNPGAEVTASLAHIGPKGWLWWVVQYRGLGTNELKVRIHPTSGEVYDEDGNLLREEVTTS